MFTSDQFKSLAFAVIPGVGTDSGGAGTQPTGLAAGLDLWSANEKQKIGAKFGPKNSLEMLSCSVCLLVLSLPGGPGSSIAFSSSPASPSPSPPLGGAANRKSSPQPRNKGGLVFFLFFFTLWDDNCSLVIDGVKL